MKIAVTLSALALTLAPVMAIAQGCSHGQTAASCVPGYAWDAEKGACIATPSS